MANWGGSAWGTSLVVGGDAVNELVQMQSDGEGGLQLPFAIDLADITDTTGILTAKSDASCFASESAFNACFALDWPTATGEGYTNLTEFVGQTAWRLFYSNGSGDVTELPLGSSGTVLKSNGASVAPTWEADATAEGAGYVSTPPTYSDEACTAGQYALTESYRYDCVASGNWNRTALTDWSNPAPNDTIPAAFSFTDVTDATLSTQYTALAQITGIDTGITCTGSGGTVAACTGSTEETCGTFGSTSGTITTGQYVGARLTSSASNSDPVNNVVVCGTGGTTDTFTATTVAGSSYLVNQTFTDATIPSGWTNVNGTWTYSGTATATTQNYARLQSPTFTGTTTLYSSTKFMVVGSIAAANNDAFLTLRTSSADVGSALMVNGAIGLDVGGYKGSTAISASTQYWVWLDAVVSGSDTLWSLYVATSDTKPGTASVTYTQTGVTQTFTNLYLRNEVGSTLSLTNIFDDVKASTTAF